MAPLDPKTPSRHWMESIEDFPFEQRKAFRDRLPTESEEAYHLAQIDDKSELALRRSHTLHTALTAVLLNQQFIRTSLLGDPDLGAEGALPVMRKQIEHLQTSSDQLPSTIRATITEAMDRRDLTTYRAIRRWIIGGIGTIVLAVITVLVVHLPFFTIGH